MQISPVQFGVATTVQSTTGYAIGLMGLGYSSNEAVTSRRYFYQNMPEVLKDAGEINSRLYSLFLNDAGKSLSSPGSAVMQTLTILQAPSPVPFSSAALIDPSIREHWPLSTFSRSTTRARMPA